MTYIWGGFTIDVFEGRFLREHKDLDGFTYHLLDVLDEMVTLYQLRGYTTRFFEDIHMLEISKNELHASFNRLDIDNETAMWRHIGDEGTVYFPISWLDDTPRNFYNQKVYTSGVRFEYAIKTNVRMINAEWQLRDKDYVSIEYLKKFIENEHIAEEDIFQRIWSYNPYWAKRGYEEFYRPTVEYPLLSR